MQHLIRKCKESDLKNLMELIQKHADFEQELYDPAGKQELMKNAIFSNKPVLFCYVVEGSDKLGGYFSYTFDFSTWEARPFLYIDCLYLEPEFRGQGIGERVFVQLREIAKQKNCVNIQWQTPVFNDNAVRFYKRMGGIGKDKVRFLLEI